MSTSSTELEIQYTNNAMPWVPPGAQQKDAYVQQLYNDPRFQFIVQTALRGQPGAELEGFKCDYEGFADRPCLTLYIGGKWIPISNQWIRDIDSHYRGIGSIEDLVRRILGTNLAPPAFQQNNFGPLQPAQQNFGNFQGGPLGPNFPQGPWNGAPQFGGYPGYGPYPHPYGPFTPPIPIPCCHARHHAHGPHHGHAHIHGPHQHHGGPPGPHQHQGYGYAYGHGFQPPQPYHAQSQSSNLGRNNSEEKKRKLKQIADDHHHRNILQRYINHWRNAAKNPQNEDV